MEEEFYAAIKLVSGEEIFALTCPTEEDDKIFLILQNPVIISPIYSRKVICGFKITPWMSIPDDDIYIINMDKIITMTEIREHNIISIYNKYLNHSTQINVNKIDGFISKVDDARRKLENIYNS